MHIICTFKLYQKQRIRRARCLLTSFSALALFTSLSRAPDSRGVQGKMTLVFGQGRGNFMSLLAYLSSHPQLQPLPSHGHCLGAGFSLKPL